MGIESLLWKIDFVIRDCGKLFQPKVNGYRRIELECVQLRNKINFKKKQVKCQFKFILQSSSLFNMFLQYQSIFPFLELLYLLLIQILFLLYLYAPCARYRIVSSIQTFKPSIIASTKESQELHYNQALYEYLSHLLRLKQLLTYLTNLVEIS